ncbi:MAG: Gfo/Idh/MocA family oxidoreductase [Anaerolineales bacterium]|nr:Gfo/Idh/MocA family oxidoreductase [Anaerolineales bacterium]
MTILIAGLGSIGRRHLRNLLALGEKDLLLLRSHHSTLPEAELEGWPVETELERALQHKPEAVIISNPTALHLAIAIPAAEAGCHLLLEKPIADTTEGIEALRAALLKGGGKALVGYHFRFHPGLQRVAELVGAGRIGRPLSARAHWGEYLPGWHPWEDYRQGYSARKDLGGGVILTLSHPLDYLHWILGEVRAVWAFSGQLGDLEIQVEDTAEIGLRFENGALGSLHLDYNQRPPTHTLEIAGTLGTIRWDNADGVVNVFTEAQGWERLPGPEGFERNHLFLEEMRHFLEVVRGQAEPACSLEDGYQALRLALAAHRSAQQEALVTL